MAARLVISLSGVDEASLGRCLGFVDDMDRRGVPLSLLVAPRLRVPVSWLVHRVAAGDALVLHGYDHRVAVGTALRIGLRAEFATLPAHEAGLRLIAASRAMERLGLATDVFVPPRWLASPGTLTALRRRGFSLCADLTAVRELRTGVVHRGRVFGFGQWSMAEAWHCRAMVLGAARLARRGGLIRLAVDTTDLARSGPRQAVLDAVDIALHHGALPRTYAALRARPAASGRAAYTSTGSARGNTRTLLPAGASFSNMP